MIGREDGGHHLRAFPRYKVFQPTEMTTSAGTTRVHLLNVSAGGALVHASEAPPPGSLLRLRCGGEQRVARVAWSSGRRFGIAFAQPLSEAQVLAGIEVTPGSPPPCRQPLSGTSVSTPRVATAQR